MPPLTPVGRDARAASYLGHEPLVIEPGVKTGMPILYEPPSDVGADRIVNGVAAFAAYGGPVIVVDFGTATTFDMVTAKGRVHRRRDLPRDWISADALFQRAARLPRVDIKRPARVIGRSTVGSIQSGLYFGYASMVEGIVERIRAELGEGRRSWRRAASRAWFEETSSPFVDAFDPHLTLHGPASRVRKEPAGLGGDPLRLQRQHHAIALRRGLPAEDPRGHRRAQRRDRVGGHARHRRTPRRSRRAHARARARHSTSRRIAPQGLTARNLARADLIVVMEKAHKARIEEMDAAAASRTRLVREFEKEAAGRKITDLDDPIGQPREAIVACLDVLERCVQNLAFRIKHGRSL